MDQGDGGVWDEWEWVDKEGRGRGMDRIIVMVEIE